MSNVLSLAPLFRQSVGFDRFNDLFESALRSSENGSSYPPYNVEQTSEAGVRITLAAAGFTNLGRDHLDSGSVASPNRETEAMKDGSDAVSDWPLLNALLNTASGATWVSLHHGGGVGMGYSQHSGVVIVADGTTEAAA